MTKDPELLIVDDEPDICLALKKFLDKQGYKVTAVHNGEEAVELLGKNNFDLILLDMVLPGMSGLDVMDYVSNNRLSTLVVVMTGFASADSAVESFRKRAYDYLIKPFDFTDLLIRVKNAVNYKRAEEERKRVEKALREAHDELEQWVEEGNEELAIAKARLRKEIEKRELAERQIKASFKEKEALLREIHPQVKNNLQIISSFLDMTIKKTQSKEAIALLKASRSRVQMMALIHMQLQKGEQFDLVHMGKLWKDLLPLVRRTYKGAKSEMEAVLAPMNVALPIEKAVPCALAANELISNAFKHAFKGREDGSVTISITRAGKDSVMMTVKDDGIGMPEDLDIEKIGTLGLNLTRDLVRDQLKGKMKIKQNMGTEVKIAFPL